MNKFLSSKSCNTSDLSFAQNPNLEMDRASREFISLLKDTSRLLKDITVVDRADCKGKIPRFDMCGISSAGAAATSCIPNNRLQDSYIDYDMVKYKTGMTHDEDMIDCGELGPRIADVAFDHLRIKVANDMEKVAILGDTSLATGDGQSDYNNLMGVNDGFLKIANNLVPSGQVIDAAGAGPSWALFMAARKLLPARYRMERGNYRYIVGPTMTDWHAEEVADRVTDGGDRAREAGVGGRLWGNDMYEVPMWPEELPYYDKEVTHILYTPLENLVYFVRRKFEFETERRISCDDYQTVAWWTADFAIAEPEKVVLIKNVALCETAWTGCVTQADDSCGEEAAYQNPGHVPTTTTT